MMYLEYWSDRNIFLYLIIKVSEQTILRKGCLSNSFE